MSNTEKIYIFDITQQATDLLTEVILTPPPFSPVIGCVFGTKQTFTEPTFFIQCNSDDVIDTNNLTNLFVFEGWNEVYLQFPNLTITYQNTTDI